MCDHCMSAPIPLEAKQNCIKKWKAIPLFKGNARKAIAYGTLIATFIVIISVIGGMNALGDLKASSLSAGPTISQTDHAVYAWNGTTWVNLPMTNSGNQLTVKTPDGFKASEILIEQENPTYNMQGLTNTSNFYDFVNIATSTTATSHTNQYINMTSAYYLIGSINNGTNMKDYSSKAFTNVYALDTLYSSTVNNLNKSVELSLFPMVEDLTGYGGYVINLNDSNVNKTTTMTLTFTQEYQHPFVLNTLAIIEGTIGVMLVIDVIALFTSEAYHYARRHVS